ncbi:MAG: ribosomal protein S18-alanine N-acetyltransferase [Methylococcales bacterium]|nr:ribosomal protein S18-alanine N-acetyltransferase [Methylococcales bacterium]
MRGLLDRLKDFLIYDADVEFYAKVFPDSVGRKELMRLRKMNRSDLTQVVAIEKSSYNFPWGEDIFRDCLNTRYDCWVCELGDDVLGYGIMSMAVGEAHILNLCVSPKEQKQGIGRKILEHLISIAKTDAEQMFLEVRPSNIHAIALYDSIGFNEIGVRKGYYEAVHGREDALMFALELL